MQKQDKTIISVHPAKIKVLQKYAVVPLRMSEICEFVCLENNSLQFCPKALWDMEFCIRWRLHPGSAPSDRER